MLKILAVGATSAIAHEALKHFAAEGATFALVGRDAARLDAVRDDLLARGARAATSLAFDVSDLACHEALLAQASDALGGLDAVLLAHGVLPDPQQAATDVAVLLASTHVNFTSAAALLTRVGALFAAQRRGVICVVSSVAGDRGRASNYVYGAAMAAKTAFVSGLRGRLARHGVVVVTVKPGMVATPMTAHLPRSLLMSEVAPVGKAVYRAMKLGVPVVYAPAWWRAVMLVIRAVPERIFMRMRF